MSPTVYKKGTSPWKQGGRTVETYRGGLIRVTETYITPSSTVENDIKKFSVGSQMDNVEQAVDGVYVYPEPQWKDNGDGFSTISVTGYGRTTTDYITELKLEESTAYETETLDGVLVSVKSLPITITSFVCRYVIKDSEESLLNFDRIDSMVRFYSSDGNSINYYKNNNGSSESKTNITRTFAFSDSSYYGKFTEAAVVIRFAVTWSTASTTPDTLTN